MAASRDEGGRWTRSLSLAAWTVAVVAGEIAAWLLVRSQGNVIGGDSPHYLIAALSLRHLTTNVLPAYGTDMISHAVYDWPAGTTVRTPSAIHAFLSGPHGPVFAQGIGVPALLAPFAAVAAVPGALIGYFAAQAAGVVLLHQRASRLGELGRGGRLLFALVLAAPALWLAATQIYPDLLSGIFLACGFVELAHLERTGRLGRLGTVVAVVAFGAVAWFQVKNAIPALIGVAGFAVVGLRHRSARGRTIVVVAVVLASLAALVGYNEFYFDRLLGLPEPSLVAGSASAWRVLALLLDRDQGLLPQVPTAILGVIGLWFARKRTRVCVSAVVAATVAVLVVNGTYPDPPMGGTSFAGRFEWTIAPMVLAWGAVFIGRLQVRPRRMLAVGLAVIGLWVVQLVPILSGGHVYSNQWYPPFRPWDPSGYPGWWPSIDGILPTFAYPSAPLGWELARLGLLIVVLAAAVWLLIRLCRPAPLRALPMVVVGATVALVIATVAVAGSAGDLPAHPLTWPGADLGSPWSPGDISYRYQPIQLVVVGAGHYRATLGYRLSGAAGRPPVVSLLATPWRRAVVSKWLEWPRPTDASLMVVKQAPLDLGRAVVSRAPLRSPPGRSESAVFQFSVTGPSTLSFEVHVPARADLVVRALSLTKTSE